MSAVLSLASGMLALAPGLHVDVPSSVYHARELGMANKGGLDVLRKSPAHYRAWVDDDAVREETKALRVGSAVHCAMLEPKRFAEEYVVEPVFGDCRTPANKKRRDEWRAEYANARIVSDDEHAMIVGMARSIAQHPVAGRMLEEGQPELTVRWNDATGVPCKARADFYVPQYAAVFDLKTCEDASTDGFRRSVAKYGYHRQHAFYARGFASVGAPLRSFVFLAIEKKAPYALALYALDNEAVGKGEATILEDLETLATCVRANRWPGYETRIQPLTLPTWAA